MNKIIKFCDYSMPFLCIFNICVASSMDLRIAWFVATMGWGAHLLEMRKHDN